MAVLKDIDKAAESKGSFLVTVWQFVKFIVVSLLAMIVQFVLLNTLQLIPAIKDLYTQEFSWWVFVYPVAVGGLGYFIVSNVANVVAQIVAFFVNKEKTFNSSANVAVTLPIYIYSKTKKFVKPDMYALCSLMLVLVLLLIMNVSSDKQVAKEKNVSKRKKTKIKG